MSKTDIWFQDDVHGTAVVEDVTAQEPRDVPVVFAPGTTVKLLGVRKHACEESLIGTVGIIDEVVLRNGSPRYCFEGTRWFSHEEFEFVAHPTKETLAAACKIASEEDDDWAE